MEIKNAVIKSVVIEIEDHGILTAWLDLDYGGAGQGFGGYSLHGYRDSINDQNACGVFIYRVLKTVGVSSWDALKGKSIRVKINDGLVRAIGNIIEDKWFIPREELNGSE